MSTIAMKNWTLFMKFDCDLGTITELSAVKTGWSILNRPALGLSFRLMIPLPERRNNPV